LLNIRPFKPGEDLAPLVALDNSFTTDRIYRVRRTALSFVLEEEAIDPPFRKTYVNTDLAAELKDMDQLLVAELGQELVGFTGVKYAKGTEARCLWLETQNTNYPAIQFYHRAGFRICGLDESLYDPQGPGRGEVAVYFAREL
jgi:hypothetical protein